MSWSLLVGLCALLLCVPACSAGKPLGKSAATYLVDCAGTCPPVLPAPPLTNNNASVPLVGLFGGAMAPGEVINSEDLPLFAQLLRATGQSCHPYFHPECRPAALVVSLTTDSNCTGPDWLSWAPWWVDPNNFDPETILPRTALTLCFTARPLESEWDALVAILTAADLIWFTGGDQSTYVRYWSASPLAAAVSAHVVTRQKPVGGESAGLAILGNGAIFAAFLDSVSSAEAIAAPYSPGITLVAPMFDFGAAAGLSNVITDTHFMQRNRMGRLLTFVSRLQVAGNLSVPVGLGISEHTGLLLDANTGDGLVMGRGPVNIVIMERPPLRCQPHHSLLLSNVTTLHLSTGALFSLRELTGPYPGTRWWSYELSIGPSTKIVATNNDGRIY